MSAKGALTDAMTGLLAQHPELIRDLIDLGSKLDSSGRLDPAVREIVILTALRRSRSEFQGRLASSAEHGVDGEMAEAILEEDWTDPTFTAEQKTAFQFALQFDAGHLISDAVLEAAQDVFDEAALVEIGLVCGYHGALARLAVGFRLDRVDV